MHQVLPSNYINKWFAHYNLNSTILFFKFTVSKYNQNLPKL